MIIDSNIRELGNSPPELPFSVGPDDRHPKKEKNLLFPTNARILGILINSVSRKAGSLHQRVNS